MSEFLKAADVKNPALIVTSTNLLIVVGMLLEDPQNKELYDYVINEYETSGLMQVVRETIISDRYNGPEKMLKLRQFSEEVEIKNSDPTNMNKAGGTYLYRVK